MKLLHTEASPGWGGQEIRILRESLGMRARGHEIFFAVQKGSGLAERAKKEGFVVYELSFEKKKMFSVVYCLSKIIFTHKIDIVNTHSSIDAWLGGVAARLTFRSIIRTRHLSTPVKGKINAFLLYNCLADLTATTCEKSAVAIQRQARLHNRRCCSIPTGIDPSYIKINPDDVIAFRKSLGINENDLLVGTCCVMRGWKGVSDLLHAAKLLAGNSSLKWLVIGGGVSEPHFKKEWRELKLEGKVIFTGHLTPPYTAIASLDLFLLLSWAHEGVSQATLQAAFLKKPLITTSIGGLSEVCLPGKTGVHVLPHSPHEVAQAVKALLQDPSKRKEMGAAAHHHVLNSFTLTTTLDKMESLYKRLMR